jgi:hypothetical protein
MSDCCYLTMNDVVTLELGKPITLELECASDKLHRR